MGKMADFYYKNNRLQQIRGFVNVVRHSSITKAAKNMNLTQPAVSCQISSLEKDLGVKLFQKSGRVLVLTADGERFYRMSVPYLQGIDTLFEDFTEQKDYDEINHIRIAAHPYVFFIQLPHIISEFSKLNNNNSNATFSFLSITKEDAVEKLIDGEIDLAIYDFSKDSIPELEICGKVTEERLLVFSNLHPNFQDLIKIKDSDITINDLHKNNLISTQRTHLKHSDDTSGSSILPQLNFHGNHTFESASYFVRLGLGVAYCPTGYASFCVDSDPSTLHSKSISHLFPPFYSLYSVKKSAILKPAVKSLISLVANSL